MAMDSGKTMKVIGLALVVLGVGLAIWGYQLSDSLTSELSEAVTGAEPDRVMRYYIGGAVSFVVGLFLVLKN